MHRYKRSVRKITLLLLCGLLLLAGCAGEEKEPAFSAAPLPAGMPDREMDDSLEQVPEPVPDPRQTAVDSVLQNMTLEEKVGQMFFVRCPDIGAVEKVSQYHLGGYLLFSRDFQDKDEQQVIDMIAGYQGASAIPLLIGADEEGGTVVRLSRNKALFERKFQSPQALFANGGMDAIREDALEKSMGILRLGVNVNFAPVADVSTDPADFIYDRAFGQDAAATAEYVRTVVAAAGQVRFAQEADGKEYAIGSVLKHFPGYGNNIDTHTGIALDERPYEQFLQEDLLPFQAGIEAGAGAVLVSHNIVNCMDDALPASLSAKVHNILRDELGFEGVVLTDDLAMDAVEAYAEDGSVAVLAVLAGNDMIVTTDFETQIPLVTGAVNAGMIDEAVIDQAVSRVLAWKYDLGLLE